MIWQKDGLLLHLPTNVGICSRCAIPPGGDIDQANSLQTWCTWYGQPAVWSDAPVWA